jgi:hypothetical protein
LKYTRKNHEIPVQPSAGFLIGCLFYKFEHSSPQVRLTRTSGLRSVKADRRHNPITGRMVERISAILAKVLFQKKMNAVMQYHA